MKMNQLHDLYEKCCKHQIDNLPLIMSLMDKVDCGLKYKFDITDKEEDMKMRTALVTILEYVGVNLIVSDWAKVKKKFMKGINRVGSRY